MNLVYFCVSYRMFVVEDDPWLLQAITELLAGRGYMLNGPAKNMASGGSVFRFGGLHVNFRKSEILRNGNRVRLSEREVRLLQFLVMHRGATVSRDTLLEYVWGYRQAPLTRTVDVTILRLRKKVEVDPRDPQFIVTVPGVGYRFNG